MGRINLATFVIVLVAFILAIFGEDARQAMRLAPAAIMNEGEYWRLVSGHFVHLNWRHAGLNMAGLMITVQLLPILNRPRVFWPSLLLAMGTIDLGLLLGSPDLNWYVGFSGVLYGLIVAGAIAAFSTADRRAGLLLVLVGLKLLYDTCWGTPAATLAWIGGPVILAAHDYGALGGIVAGLMLRGLALHRSSSEK